MPSPKALTPKEVAVKSELTILCLYDDVGLWTVLHHHFQGVAQEGNVHVLKTHQVDYSMTTGDRCHG